MIQIRFRTVVPGIYVSLRRNVKRRWKLGFGLGNLPSDPGALAATPPSSSSRPAALRRAFRSERWSMAANKTVLEPIKNLNRAGVFWRQKHTWTVPEQPEQPEQLQPSDFPNRIRSPEKAGGILTLGHLIVLIAVSSKSQPWTYVAPPNFNSFMV